MRAFFPLTFGSLVLARSLSAGVPTKIAWKPFYNNLPPPSLKGPGGLKWKTRRTPDEDNDPRFPDFW